MKIVVSVAVLFVVLIQFTTALDSWPNWGGGLTNDHFSNQTNITDANASDLQIKWLKRVGYDVTAAPSVSNGVAYFPDYSGNLWAISVSTGATIWRTRIETYTGIHSTNYSGNSYFSGSFSRNTPAIDSTNGRLYLGDQVSANFICVNISNGALIWITLLDPHPYAIITQSATVYDGRVFVGVSSNEEGAAIPDSYVCCSFQGSFAALDAATGAFVWRISTVPTAIPGYSGNAVWGSSPSIDPDSRSVYIATGNNYKVPDDVQECINRAANDSSVVCPNDPNNLAEAIISINIDTGNINWNLSFAGPTGYDVWNVACIFGNKNCPPNAGEDADFGQAPMIIRTPLGKQLVGAGQKNGFFLALHKENGTLAWLNALGGGGTVGGSQWGSAYDGERIYVAIANSLFKPHILPDGTQTFGGFWVALNPEDGTVIWETPVPQGLGITAEQAALIHPVPWSPITVTNGVLFAAVTGIKSGEKNMYALDVENGKILWSFGPEAAVVAAPTIADGVLLWGSGYAFSDTAGIGDAVNSTTFYAFSVPNRVGTTCPTCPTCPSPAPTNSQPGTTINFYFADMLAGAN